jgi:hypothetical protein
VAVIRPSFPEDHFTRVPNAWLRDPNLDPAPKAYLCYLLSHAAGYACSTSQAAREMGVNRSTVTAWNAKLVERGYFLAVEQRQGAGGRFAENDYVMTSCTATVPPLHDFHAPSPPTLHENRAPSRGETARSTVTAEPCTVEPSRSDRARSIQHIEEQGEKNTGRRTPQTPLVELPLDGDEERKLRDKLAHTIATEDYEATGKLGGSKAFLAVRGIVAGALESGHPEQQIRAALAHLRQRGRSVTNRSLGPLLADPRTVTSNGHRPATSSNYGPRYQNPDPRTDPHAFEGLL